MNPTRSSIIIGYLRTDAYTFDLVNSVPSMQVYKGVVIKTRDFLHKRYPISFIIPPIGICLIFIISKWDPCW